jgi:Zn-dependent protease
VEELSIIQKIAIMAPPLIFAIVLHEVAHGWVANKLGDHTAKDMGRLTLNPISHIDLFGTIIMPILLFVVTNGRFVFGSAKPVPINPYNFKNPKKGMALSSLAGPAANLIMAVTFTFLLRVVIAGLEGRVPKDLWTWFFVPVTYMLFYGVLINIVLAVLNLIPIPPLDGSRVAYWLLPDKQAALYYRLEPYGMFIILGLFGLGILGKMMTPIVGFLIYLLLGEKIM